MSTPRIQRCTNGRRAAASRDGSKPPHERGRARAEHRQHRLDGLDHRRDPAERQPRRAEPDHLAIRGRRIPPDEVDGIDRRPGAVERSVQVIERRRETAKHGGRRPAGGHQGREASAREAPAPAPSSPPPKASTPRLTSAPPAAARKASAPATAGLTYNGAPADHRGRDPAPQRPAVEGRVPGQRAERPGVDGDRQVRREHRDVGRPPLGQGAALDAEDARRIRGEQPHESAQRHAPRMDEPVQTHRQPRSRGRRRRRGAVELGELLVEVVRRVVGGHAVDGAVGEAGEQGLDVGRAAQRRVHLAVRVVVGQPIVGEGQVVRGDLAGDRRPARLRRPDHPQRAADADVREMDRRPP